MRMRYLITALFLSGCGMITESCDLGWFWGGQDGTSKCGSGRRFYQDDVLYQLGLPYTTTGPDGATYVIPASPLRQQLTQPHYGGHRH